MARGRVAALVVAALLPACAARVPVLPIGEHTPDDAVEVPFGPPPVPAEIVSSPPSEMVTPRWVDGAWEWRAGAWAWVPGRWVPWLGESVRYAPPRLVVRPDGTLVWLRGAVRLPKGAERLRAAEAIAPKAVRLDAPPPRTVGPSR